MNLNRVVNFQCLSLLLSLVIDEEKKKEVQGVQEFKDTIQRRRRKKVFPKFESQSLSTFRTLVQIQRNNKYDESIERFKKFYAKEREREKGKKRIKFSKFLNKVEFSRLFAQPLLLSSFRTFTADT